MSHQGVRGSLSWKNIGLLAAVLACEPALQGTADPAEIAEQRGSVIYAQTQLVWEAPVEIATGPAHVGPWRMNESEFHYVTDASVAVSPEGNIGVVWADNQRKNVYFRIYDADGVAITAPVDVSRSPEIFSWLPRVELTEGGEVFVLWQEIVFSGGSHGGEIFFARSTDGGRSFEPSINLSNTTAGAGKGRLTEDAWSNGSLDMLRGARGELFVAWTEYEGALRFSRSTDGGASFMPPVHVAGNDRQPARAPSLAMSPQGTLYLAWTVGEDRSGDIALIQSDDRGETFGRSRTVLQTQAYSDGPKIAVDGDGTLHLVYSEGPRGTAGRAQVLYTRRANDRLEFDQPVRISGPPGQEGASFPSLDIDGEDNVYVVFEHHPGHAERASGLGFTWSVDGGDTFARPSAVLGTDDPALGVNGSLQGQLGRKLAVGRDGEIAIVNSRFRLNHSSRVRLLRGRTVPR